MLYKEINAPGEAHQVWVGLLSQLHSQLRTYLLLLSAAAAAIPLIFVLQDPAAATLYGMGAAFATSILLMVTALLGNIGTPTSYN